MAYLEYQKQQKQSQTSTSTSNNKPTYKGPPGKPNRFNIKPGYRWDGIDRSNNFEEKVFKRMYEGKRKHDDSYRMRTADM